MRPASWRCWRSCCCAGRRRWASLRGRASRMQPLESLEVVKGLLNALAAREEPLARELPPMPGSRAERYAQLLCPALHPITDAPTTDRDNRPSPVATAEHGRIEQAIERLEAECRADSKTPSADCRGALESRIPFSLSDCLMPPTIPATDPTTGDALPDHSPQQVRELSSEARSGIRIGATLHWTSGPPDAPGRGNPSRRRTIMPRS